MSNQITTSMVKQYGSNVYHLVQQKGSRFLKTVDIETQVGEEQFFDQMGSVDAREKVGRHSKVLYNDTPHSRRRVVFKDFYYADMVDNEDKLRTIIDPTNQYAVAARMALSRKLDDEILLALLGTAYTGKEGTGTATMANANKLAATDGASTTGSNLNVLTLRKAKKYFWDNEAIDDDMGEEELFMAVDPSQLDSLLGQTEVTSTDYNTVKALVQGDVNSFMGFKFIRSKRLLQTAGTTNYTVASGAVATSGEAGNVAAGARRVVAWQRYGIKGVMPRSIFTRITPEMAEYHYNTQVYAAMSFGAVRMEEERVLEIICKE